MVLHLSVTPFMAVKVVRAVLLTPVSILVVLLVLGDKK
jgi:hypothetical protein